MWTPIINPSLKVTVSHKPKTDKNHRRIFQKQKESSIQTGIHEFRTQKPLNIQLKVLTMAGSVNLTVMERIAYKHQAQAFVHNPVPRKSA